MQQANILEYHYYLLQTLLYLKILIVFLIIQGSSSSTRRHVSQVAASWPQNLHRSSQAWERTRPGKDPELFLSPWYKAVKLCYQWNLIISFSLYQPQLDDWYYCKFSCSAMISMAKKSWPSGWLCSKTTWVLSQLFLEKLSPQVQDGREKT